MPDTKYIATVKDADGQVYSYIDTEAREELSAITAASSSDVGKLLSPKTVSNGKVTEWQYSQMDSSSITSAVDNYLSENFTNPSNPPLDRSLLSSSSAAPADIVGQINNSLSNKPQIIETEESTANLYFADNNGYVVAQLANGHIQTQNFDSSRSSLVESTTESGVFDIADSQGYVVARFKNGDIKTKNFDSSKINKGIIEYKFSGNDVMVSYGYNSTHDAVVIFNIGRANDLFDFSSFKIKQKGLSLENITGSSLTNVWSSSTDMHGPFQFNAVENPDGYYSSSNSPSFTGGNHTVSIDGTNVKSASSKYVYYFADGRPVTSGYGTCNKFEIKWANNVQAYNCVKADGTGRTSLIEYHDMIFDGVKFNEEVILIPTEQIRMKLWYGFQTVSWGQKYTTVRFIDGANRGVYTNSDSNINSGNNTTSGIVMVGPVHSMETRVDTNFDLGKRLYYSGTKGAFMSNSSYKSYYNIINDQTVTMNANEGYFLRGSYRFYPTVS